MNVKTKNWGPEFKHLSNMFGLKGVALSEHTTKLNAEVAAHDGSHAYGRHGAQTGWEAQMIRACTKVTPDQAHDPMGLNPTIRHWNGVMAMSDIDGSTVFDLFGDNGNAPETHTTAAGNIAGGFITPEAQFLARKRGEAVVATLIGPASYAANYRFKTEKKFARFPLNSVHIVVGSSKPGQPYGLGFERRDPRNYRDHSHAFVSACIDGFLNRKTWAQIIPNLSASTFKFNVIALKKNKIAFPEITDLFEFFDLDVLWQGTCSLIYRRVHNAGPHTHEAWRLITMFPNSIAAGWAPSLWLSDAAKLQLVAQKMNKNVDDYHWTGVTSSFAGNLKQTYPVPPWS